jgi:hypothetical protein
LGAILCPAALLDGLALDAVMLEQDSLAAAEVDVSWGQIVQAFVATLVVVVLDEASNLRFQVAGQTVVFERGEADQQTVQWTVFPTNILGCLVPALDFAPDLRMARHATNVLHAARTDPLGQIARDAARFVAHQESWTGGRSLPAHCQNRCIRPQVVGLWWQH